MTENAFMHEIEKCITSGEVSLPVCNPTALKVQQELVKKEPDTYTLEKLIIGDQSPSSQILRMANSAFYRGLADMTCHKLGIDISQDQGLNLAATAEASLLELSEIDLAELEVMLEDTASLFS